MTSGSGALKPGSVCLVPIARPCFPWGIDPGCGSDGMAAIDEPAGARKVLGFMPVPLTSRRRPRPRVLAGTVYVSRQVHFNAAHRLHNPTRSAAWNRATFGPCNNPRWHGHNYVLEVTVAGVPDPETGYVIDLARLKQVLEREIIDVCDHRNLNEEVPWLRGVIPSTENLVIAFWHRIAPRIPSGRLHRVRLFETPRNYADYFGPEGLPALPPPHDNVT